MNKFDQTKNRILLGMEDGDEKWHSLDMTLDEFKTLQVLKDSVGTFDKKTVKYRVISIPKVGEGAVMKYGDESDWHVEDGVHFPHIPPPLPEGRLPNLLVNTQVSFIFYIVSYQLKCNRRN